MRLFVILAFAVGVGLSGCQEESPAEKAQEKTEEAVEEVGDAMEEAGDEIEDATN